MTQRFASNMVFMSLLLSTELGVLFNSSHITTEVREHLRAGNHLSISFWAGFMIICSTLLTLFSLISTFTAWAMVNAVDEANAHCIFRSSIGQYAAELPGRFIVCSIYSFLISFLLFLFLLLPFGIWSITLLVVSVALFIHVVAAFSAFGRVIMHTGAMGKARIFDPNYEAHLLPHSLHADLLNKAKANLANKTSVIRQYRRRQKPIDRLYSEDELLDHLSCRGSTKEETTEPHRRRSDSQVRFADEEQGVLPEIRRQHQRNLTSMSDITQQTPPLGLSATRKSLDKAPVVSPPPPLPAAAIAKPSPTTTRPPLPNLNKPMSIQEVGNVSSSSLEQWLQASPLSTTSNGAGDETPTSSHRHNVPQVPSTSSWNQSLPTSPWLWTSSGGRLSSTSMDSDKSSDRHLSEEERFFFDYGEVDDQDNNQSPAQNTNYLEEDKKEDPEQASLLGNTRQGNYRYDSANQGNRNLDGQGTARKQDDNS
jgi:hypothetical protein